MYAGYEFIPYDLVGHKILRVSEYFRPLNTFSAMHLHRALIGLAVAVLHRGIAKNPEPVEATRDVSGTKVDYGKADPYSVKDIGNEADDSDYDPYEGMLQSLNYITTRFS